MDMSDTYKSNTDYLKADDLPAGKQVPVTIEAVGEEFFLDNPNDSQSEKGKNKLILTFKGKDKGMVLNKTNAMVIANVHGSETDEWIGKEIQIFSTMVDFAGKMVPAIRLNAFTEGDAGVDDDIPF